MVHISGAGEGGGATNTDQLANASDVPGSTTSDALNYLLTSLGTAKLITSQDDLESEFPNVAGVHTINLPTVWTAPVFGTPITLIAGRSVVVTHPGSITGLGIVKVVILGNAVGPLVSGELSVSDAAVVNQNPAGWDVEGESLLGRPMPLRFVTLAGANAGIMKSGGGLIIDQCVIQPPVGVGAVGLSFTGTFANLSVTGILVNAPGDAAYTALTFDATSAITNLLDISSVQFNGVAGDSIVSLSPSMTLPTGPLPTTTVGARVKDSLISGPADVFAAGSLGDADIEVIASNNIGGRSSNYLADVAVTTGANPTIALVHTGGGVDDIIPYDNSGNGGAGGTLSTLAAVAVQERWSLDISNPSPVIWYVRLDGPARVLNGNILYQIEMSKSGGASPVVTAVLLRSVALGPYLPIESSRSEEVTLVTAPRRVRGTAWIPINNGDRFALAVRTDSPGTNTEITLVEVDIPGKP